ncbi:DNA adenine methylase [Sporanaerobacter acetigenes]|uniref:site-specific DNA-methyltransferase (adenine-specific) n=1 Tax=Sporanaerobacter acetigenes DSM 13106 TaxID=1123281 RepID=A0A1M5U500_9FIRM|nr:DNA adenine methylase [Sporanaerobacter acetigenes]SHH57936.1 DNA adenine methylase [Sporanaerobacter acetigenes DSM 13106]
MTRTLSPLRYPGGKTKLYKYTKKLIEHNNLVGCTYVEPFAGGCGLAIGLLHTNIVNNIILNDIDRSIYAFWKTVLDRNEELIEKIDTTPITIDEWHKQKEIQDSKFDADLFELGFSTLFLNRTNFSGIIKAGPIGGHDQNGPNKLDCRFNKKDIIRKLKLIKAHREQIQFYNEDAIDFFNILNELNHDNFFIFLDPPYFENGPGLYTNFYTEEDHRNLARHVSELNHNWIVTYDNVDKIKEIYQEYNFESKEYSLRYSAYNKYEGTEIMFYSNNLIPVNF